jgi:ribose transport system substrate-binding protein
MHRKIAAGLTAVAIAASLTACASSGIGGGGGNEDDTPTIGLAVANLQADFFNQIRQSVEDEAEKEGVEVIVSDAKGDSDTQVSQIQDFITQGVDAIIYIPAGATAATVPVRAAKDAGIPIVTVDRNPDGAPGDTFIATDSVAAAAALGDWVVEQTSGTGNVGIIQGQIGTTPQVARQEGFTSALEGTDLKVVAEQASAQWAQDEGYDIATDMLQSNPDITVFFGQADALALGASAAARAAGADVLVVGFDGDVAGLEAVRDGTLAATITQPTQGMGRLAVQSALQLIAGEELPAEQLQEGVLTTPENVEPFIETHP